MIICILIDELRPIVCTIEYFLIPYSMQSIVAICLGVRNNWFLLYVWEIFDLHKCTCMHNSIWSEHYSRYTEFVYGFSLRPMWTLHAFLWENCRNICGNMVHRDIGGRSHINRVPSSVSIISSHHSGNSHLTTYWDCNIMFVTVGTYTTGLYYDLLISNCHFDNNCVWVYEGLTFSS